MNELDHLNTYDTFLLDHFFRWLLLLVVLYWIFFFNINKFCI